VEDYKMCEQKNKQRRSRIKDMYERKGAMHTNRNNTSFNNKCSSGLITYMPSLFSFTLPRSRTSSRSSA
jgi:hypothetical protein